MEELICWIQSIDLENIKNVLVSIPGIFLTGFSFYFAFQKLGNNVLVTYSYGGNRTSANRVTELTLINKKNKPVTIFSIHAVLNNDIVIEIEAFKPAVILKPLETIHIETTPYSVLYLGDDKYDPNFIKTEKIDIYIISHNKKIKCKTITPPSLKKYFDFDIFHQTTKFTKKYNNKVYGDNVRYAVIYRIGSDVYTGLIDNAGFISGDWEYQYNSIPESNMGSKELVKEYLDTAGYDKFFDGYNIDELK